jgi:2-keto-4-pentenoate hydratase/2-oxohepta-3-ene-1,7-dioic acid hydratase in catechol pathway
LKIYRFRHQKKVRYGVLKEEALYPVRGSIFENFSIEKKGIAIGSVALLPPVEPSKIVAVGTNYKEHGREMGKPVPKEPLIFLKPPSAVIGPNGDIIYPETAGRVDFEGELAVVIKKKTQRLRDEDDPAEYILGFTCFNDVTARDLQLKDVQFIRAKSFDTFAAVGPCIATGLDSSRLRIKTFLNGKLKQSANTGQMIFPVPVLIRFISAVMTLYPGDIITTGTPSGVAPMLPGDRVDVQIEGIGTLSNAVIAMTR